MSAGDLLWTPPADVRDRTRVGDFLRFLERTRGLRFDDYASLWRWSVGDLSGFWSAVWTYFGVTATAEPTDAIADLRMPGAKWFPGATLNYAEHVLRMPGIADDETVVLAYSESRPPVRLTAGELREQVRRVRAGLSRLGVRRGDRVAAYAPNIPETFILMLASASLGAIFSSCAPEFGTRSVVDRWRQIEPTVLLAVDGYRYGDKPVDRATEVAEIRAALPSLVHVVSLPYLDADLGGGWSDLTAPTDEPLTFEAVPFDHPLYVLYSSGTTGLPKPIVHGHGGILLEHLKMLALHSDLGPGDRFFWFTTTGWMMWNFLVSGPAVGSAIVMYDGNPAHPDLTTLWRLAEEAGVTYFGTSAPFLLACRKAGIVPGELADLSRVRALGSTGAPLPPEGFRWVYEAVNPKLCSCTRSRVAPTCARDSWARRRCCRCTRERSPAVVSVRRWRPSTKTVGAVVGSVGELVITAPMPSMPVGFWNDPDGSRYREAYFDTYPGVWRHGDWITITQRGTCVITGRSDATLNRGGVRPGYERVLLRRRRPGRGRGLGGRTPRGRPRRGG